MITTAVSTFEFFESFTLQGDDDSWSRVPLKHLIYLLQCTSLIIPFLVPLTLWYLIIFAWRFHYNLTVSDACNIINIVVVIWYFQVRKNREKDFLFRSIMALLSLQTLIVFSILTMLTGSWSRFFSSCSMISLPHYMAFLTSGCMCDTQNCLTSIHWLMFVRPSSSLWGDNNIPISYSFECGIISA